MRVAILSLLSFIAAASNAQQIHKCIKGSAVSYQSAPCEAGHSLVKQWTAAPDPGPAATPSGHRQEKREQDEAKSSQAGRGERGRRTRAGSRPAKSSSIADADKRCAAAKSRREARLISAGLKRTFDLLRKLDDAVHEACKP